MKKTCYSLLTIPLLMILSCNDPSPESKAQEERRDSTEYFHTSYPATKGEAARSPDTGSEKSADTAAGSREDTTRP
jgi:hypothetical protein